MLFIQFLFLRTIKLHRFEMSKQLGTTVITLPIWKKTPSTLRGPREAAYEHIMCLTNGVVITDDIKPVGRNIGTLSTVRLFSWVGVKPHQRVSRTGTAIERTESQSLELTPLPPTFRLQQTTRGLLVLWRAAERRPLIRVCYHPGPQTITAQMGIRYDPWRGVRQPPSAPQ